MEEITVYTVQPTDKSTGSPLMDRFVQYTDRKATTTKGYLCCLRQFAKWLSSQDITRPTRDDVMAYRDYLNGDTFGRSGHETLTAGTKQQYLRAVKHFFRWTSSEGLYPNIADNIHGAKVRNDTHKRDALTLEETKSVESSIDRTTIQGKRLYALYLLGARRGLRTVEMSRASIKDLEEKGGVMYLNIWGKGHDEADVKRALDTDTADAIRDYLEARGHYTATDPLFVSTSNNSKGQRLAPTTISTMLKRALVKAGYDSSKLTAHSLRHTAATISINNANGDIYAAQTFLRHADPATTERYTHVDDVKKDLDLVEKVYNNYHDSDATADLRQEGHALLDELDADELDEVINYMHDMKATKKIAV